MAFLASFDNNNVTVYEGITWGYQFTCVPEPSTYGLWGGGVLLLLVVVAKRRIRTAPTSRGDGGRAGSRP